jgi:hypothetical protein
MRQASCGWRILGCDSCRCRRRKCSSCRWRSRRRWRCGGVAPPASAHKMSRSVCRSRQRTRTRRTSSDRGLNLRTCHAWARARRSPPRLGVSPSLKAGLQAAWLTLRHTASASSIAPGVCRDGSSLSLCGLRFSANDWKVCYAAACEFHACTCDEAELPSQCAPLRRKAAARRTHAALPETQTASPSCKALSHE